MGKIGGCRMSPSKYLLYIVSFILLYIVGSLILILFYITGSAIVVLFGVYGKLFVLSFVFTIVSGCFIIPLIFGGECK